MSITDTAVALLNDRLGVQVDPATLSGALGALIGNNGGQIDLAGLASQMASSGNLGSIVSSWLGDGSNASISAQDILGLFGESNVADFASSVGTDTGTAASGLADVLPQVMDKASSGGSLLDAVGGAGGLLGAAKSLLG